MSIALGVLLFFSALLNVAQYQHQGSALAKASLGDGRYAMHAVHTLEKPSKHGKCAQELVHMCVDERSAMLASPSSLGSSAMARDWESMKGKRKKERMRRAVQDCGKGKESLCETAAKDDLTKDRRKRKNL